MMNDTTPLIWETVDPDAPFPQPCYRAVASPDDEYIITHYIPARDRKFDRGHHELWGTEGGGLVGYSPTLAEAKHEAEQRAARRAAQRGARTTGH